MKVFTLFLAFGLIALTTASAQQAEFVKIESKNFKRLYRLNDSLYRSEQPNKKGFQELEDLGIKSVINFRRVKDHGKKAKASSLNLYHYPLKASELTEEELLQALRLIQNAEKPVLIHCWHGSDRTGAVAAASRMLFENWSAEKAITELKTKGFGHHEKRFSNITVLLSDIDIERIREELGN